AGATECVQFLRIPLIVVGSVLCAVALAGFIGAVNDIAWLLFIYLAVVFIAIWVLLGFTVFAFIVTNQAVADAVSNKGVGSWKTTDFSTWLQNQVTEQSKWAPIQACLAAGNTCGVLSQTNTTASSSLTAIQSCPSAPLSATSRADLPANTTDAAAAAAALASAVNSTISTGSFTGDCLVYGSEPAKLCYGCDTCKAAFLKTLRDQWRMVAFVCLGVSLLLLVVYIVGCCAYRSAKRREGFFGKCVQIIRIPLILAGSVLFAVALAGFIGAVNDIAWLLFLYLAVVFIAIWVLLGFTAFAFIVTNQAAADAVSNKAVGSWNTTDFSTWLQNQVTEQSKWAPIQACLAAGNTCGVLSQTNTIASSALSPIQAGCCYPPQSCPSASLTATSRAAFPTNTSAANATAATAAALASTVNSTISTGSFTGDCLVYGSEPTKLCYGCDTCKAAFLKMLRDQWRIVAFVCLGVSLLLLVIYIVGCCAYRSAKQREGFLGKV
ncbi:unnamed protein product, partial [Closterium sp. Naga37s-1]